MASIPIPGKSYTISGVQQAVYDAYTRICTSNRRPSIGDQQDFYTSEKTFDEMGMDSLDVTEIIMAAANDLNVALPEGEAETPAGMVEIFRNELRESGRFTEAPVNLQDRTTGPSPSVIKLP